MLSFSTIIILFQVEQQSGVTWTHLDVSIQNKKLATQASFLSFFQRPQDSFRDLRLRNSVHALRHAFTFERRLAATVYLDGQISKANAPCPLLLSSWQTVRHERNYKRTCDIISNGTEAASCQLAMNLRTRN